MCRRKPASRSMALGPEYAFYGAAAYMALAARVQLQQGEAGAASVAACHERALGYLETAVLTGLPDAKRRSQHELFAPLHDNPRFKALFD